MNDVRDIYLRALKNTTRQFVKGWALAPLAVGLYSVSVAVAMVCSGLGLFGQLLAGLVAILLMTAFYSALTRAYEGTAVFSRDLLHIDAPLLSSLVSVGFIFFLATLPINMLAKSDSGPWIQLCVSLGIVIIFNSVIEVIVVHRSEGMAALAHAYQFTVSYWLEWFIPMLILMAPWIISARNLVLFSVAQTDALMPSYPAFAGLSFFFKQTIGLPWIPGTIGALCCMAWYLLFRLNLFELLDRRPNRLR